MTASAHSIRGLREQFRAVGKFHTPPELALKLRSLVPGEPRDVYDPTCGAGALLSVFAEDTPKFGQDIDAVALSDAQAIPNFHGHHGDVLTNPAWLDQRFHAIVANPPFSIKWVPVQLDERFVHAPTVPTQSRADYAFILHILHMLADDGVAVVLNAPGVLYRDGREAQIREYLVNDLNVIDQVIHIPGDTFEDTTIPTVIIVMRKNRAADDPILFRDEEHDIERAVTREEIADEDYFLAVSRYAAPEPVDPWEDYDPAEQEALLRASAITNLRNAIEFAVLSANVFNGRPVAEFLDCLQAVINEYKEGGE